MTTTLVLTEAIGQEIAQAAQESLETAGVVLASVVEAPKGALRLLAQSVVWATGAAYLERHVDRLTMAPEAYVPALGRAADRGLVPIWLHTHPGETGRPTPSCADAEVDLQLADVFRLRAETPWYATLIVSPRPGGLAFTGRLSHESGEVRRVDRLWQVGSGWRLQRAFDTGAAELAPLFDRNVRAFGSDIQGALGDLRIGVVGVGGTGSAVCEQLVRLGVRNLTLFDADTLSLSNVTRVYGSTPRDVGRPKVEVACDHLTAIAQDLACDVHASMITLEAAARQLTSCDIVFGCSDDNAGRLVLSRIATYLLTPVIDVGVLLSADGDGRLAGIDGRITVLSPGSACLVCRGRIDLRRAASELMTPDERVRLENEGYAPALGGTEPAVVAFTTAVAAAAVNELLERLIGYGPQPRPSEILLRWHEREISTNTAAPRAGHYCAADSGKFGWGARAPFLEQVWPGA
jgi:molybdopterin/thiamine biosynthesis adenylyltransferase